MNEEVSGRGERMYLYSVTNISRCNRSNENTRRIRSFLSRGRRKLGVWYFHVSRKCGGLVFSRVQKMWGRCIFTHPENVGERYFQVSRKCGRVRFSRTQKMRRGGISKCPENVGTWCFRGGGVYTNNYSSSASHNRRLPQSGIVNRKRT
jgi:hypothetical protein